MNKYTIELSDETIKRLERTSSSIEDEYCTIKTCSSCPFERKNDPWKCDAYAIDEIILAIKKGVKHECNKS